MNREQKTLVIQALKEDFSKSKASFLIGFRGLTVNQMQKLRRELGSKGGTLKVAKARLMKRAVEGQDGDDFAAFFKDQVGMVFADDPSAVAKILHDFSKENESLRLVVGLLDDYVLDAQGISRIATLPSKEVLLGQLCGTLKAPIAGLAIGLNMLMLKLLWTLKQVGEKKQ